MRKPGSETVYFNATFINTFADFCDVASNTDRAEETNHDSTEVFELSWTLHRTTQGTTLYWSLTTAS